MKQFSPIQTPRLQTGKPEITMAPLVDVVFLLLIFFMVTTIFPEDHTLLIEQPESKSADVLEAEKITLVVDKTGAVEFKNQPIEINDIENVVRDQLRKDARTAVLIKIDKHAPTELFIQVLDACKSAGAQQVGIATDASAP